MEEYTRKHLSESVYPFAYVRQPPLHIFALKWGREEQNRS